MRSILALRLDELTLHFKCEKNVLKLVGDISKESHECYQNMGIGFFISLIKHLQFKNLGRRS